MSGVDVLAVLRRHAIAERERLGTTDNDTQAALAAVAGLMEAIKPLAELDLRPDGFDKRHDDQTIYARDRSTITVGDVRRAAAALARCQPAEIPTDLNVDTAAPVAPGVVS